MSNRTVRCTSFCLVWKISTNIAVRCTLDYLYQTPGLIYTKTFGLFYTKTFGLFYTKTFGLFYTWTFGLFYA